MKYFKFPQFGVRSRSPHIRFTHRRIPHVGTPFVVLGLLLSLGGCEDKRNVEDHEWVDTSKPETEQMVPSHAPGVSLALRDVSDEATPSGYDYYALRGIEGGRTASAGASNDLVDPYKGSLSLHRVDLVLPGDAGPAIVVGRSYHSDPRVLSAAAPGQGYFPTENDSYPLGYGWRLHLGEVSSYWPLGAGARCQNPDEFTIHNPVVSLPDGTQLVMYNSRDGDAYDPVSRSWHIGRCIEDDGAGGAADAEEHEGGLRLTTPDGITYVLNHREERVHPLEVVTAALGGSHTCALMADRVVRCWGNNNRGQLGLGHTQKVGDQFGEVGPHMAWVDLGVELTTFTSDIVAGFAHTCALLSTGEVKCWGDNEHGQLGQGNEDTIGDDEGEVADLDVIDFGTDLPVDEIAAGSLHSCVLIDGDAYCWGSNAYGQLGAVGDDRGDDPDEMGVDLSSVDLDGATMIGISAGDRHSCALGMDGNLRCWGSNDFGQLGLGGLVSGSVVHQPDEMGANLPLVPVFPNAVVEVAAGGFHTCARSIDGDVKCWGSNDSGQLGIVSGQPIGDEAAEIEALAPVDLGEPAISISAGRRHSCAVLESGAVRCWGLPQFGLTRDPLSSDEAAIEVFSGNDHNCVLLDDSQIKCWGANGEGQLGVGNRNHRGDDANELGLALPPLRFFRPYTYLLNQIQDRHGNAIHYTYKGDTRFVDTITGTDHGTVTFGYEGAGKRRLLKTVSDGTRTFAYHYTPTTYEDSPIGDALPARDFRFLTSVVGPEGMTWRYQYDLDSPLDTPGLFQLEKITNPLGGTTTFGYQRVSRGSLGQFFPTLGLQAIRTRETGGIDVEPGTWVYTFEDSTDEFDRTTVTTPLGSETYKFCGEGAAYVLDQCLARAGTLLEKRIFDASDATNPVQTETLTWRNSTDIISDQHEVLARQPSEEPGAQPGTTVPVFTSGVASWRLVQRTASRDGDDYTTVYDDHDRYDNPRKIFEYAAPALPYGTGIPTTDNRRDTERTYHVDENLWLLHLVKTERLHDKLAHAGVVWAYDDKGDLRSVNAYGDVTHYNYHSNGNLRSIRNPRSVGPGDMETEFLDYRRGIAQRVTFPEGVSITRVVNDVGAVTQETDPEKNPPTIYWLDDLMRPEVIETPRPDDTNITIAYTWATGTEPATRTITRGARIETVELDGFGRTRKVTLTNGSDSLVTRSSYDALGRLVLVTDVNSEDGTRFEYDVLGRETRRTATADGARVTTDYLNDYRTKITDAKGHATTHTFRAFGTPDARYLLKTESPEGMATEITRLARGDVLSISQGGHTRGYQYDHRYRIDRELHPEIGEIDHDYDAAGNLTRYGPDDDPENSAVHTRVYDGLGRPTHISYPDPVGDRSRATNIAFVYDKNSRLEQVRRVGSVGTDGPEPWRDSIVDFKYDEHGNLLSETLTTDGRSFTISYEYDELDHLESVTLPDETGRAGVTFSLNPDALGRPREMGQFVTNISYDSVTGHIDEVSYKNGMTAAFEYDARQRLQKSIVNGRVAAPAVEQVPEPFVNLTYSYDSNGNIETITDTLNASESRSYTYDGLNRLVNVSGPWGSGSFTYNTMNNIVLKKLGGETIDYRYTGADNSGTVLAYVTQTVSGEAPVRRDFFYDHFGNVTRDGDRVLTYDEASQMVAFAAADGTETRYVYDGLGRRIKKVDGRGTRYMIHNRAGVLVYEQLNLGQERDSYVRLGRKVMAHVHFECEGDECLQYPDPTDETQQADNDGDGLRNYEEATAGTDPDNPDSDGDGIRDDFESSKGLNPLDASDRDADPDGDNYSNYHEYLSDSDPHDGESRPRVYQQSETRWAPYAAAASSFAVGPDGRVVLSRGPEQAIQFLNRNLEAEWVFSDLAGNVLVNRPGRPTLTDVARTLVPMDAAESDKRGVLLINPYLENTQMCPEWSERVGEVALTHDNALLFRDHQHLYRADLETCESTWLYTFSPGSAGGHGAPLVTRNGTTYVSSRDGVFAMDGTPDKHVWKFAEDIAISAVDHDGTVYGCHRGDGVLVALNAEGTEKWRYDAGGECNDVTLDQQGRVYLPVTNKLVILMPDGTLGLEHVHNEGKTSRTALAADGTVYFGSEQHFVAFDPATQQERWSKAVPSSASEPAIHADGTVYVNADKLYTWSGGLFNGLQDSAWPMAGADARRTSRQARCESEAPDGDGDGLPDCWERLVGLDPTRADSDGDGVSDGRGDLEGDGVSNREEFMAGSHPYNADSDGDGLGDAIEGVVGSSPISQDTDRDGVPDGYEHESSCRSPVVREAEDRDYDQDGDSDLAEHLGGSDPCDNHSRVPGTVLWTLPLPGYTAESAVAVAPDGTIYVTSETSGELLALNPDKSPREGWEVPYKHAALPTFVPTVAADGTVYVLYDDATLHAIRPDKTEKWAPVTIPLGFDLKLALGPDGTVYVTNRSPGQLHAFDPETGQVRWADPYDPEAPIGSAPVVGSDGTIYFTTTAGETFSGELHAVTPSGSAKWSRPGDLMGRSYAAPAIGADETVFAVSDSRRVFWFDPDSGTGGRSPLLRGKLRTSPIVDEDGFVYVMTGERRLYAVEFEAGSGFSSPRELWSGGGWSVPEVGIPALVADGSVVFSTYGGHSDRGIFAYDRASQQEVWSIVEDEPTSDSPMTVAPDGTIYTIVGRHVLYAIAGPRGVAQHPWPQAGCGSQHQGRAGCAATSSNMPPRPKHPECGQAGDGIPLPRNLCVP